MFGIFKKKSLQVFSPVDGEIVELESVPDEVFANKLAGDGVAIIPASGQFCSPVDGVVSKIFDTNHAYIVSTPQGIDILVHIGLDTVSLNSNGFKRKVEPDTPVKVGDVIIEADLNYIKENSKDTITPIVISDGDCKIIEQQYGHTDKKSLIFELK